MTRAVLLEEVAAVVVERSWVEMLLSSEWEKAKESGTRQRAFGGCPKRRDQGFD